MDPGAVRATGGVIGQAAERVRSLADALELAAVPHGSPDLSIGLEATAALRVWVDGVRALATELQLLDDRCAASAAAVRAEDDVAHAAFRGPRLVRPSSTAG